MIRRLNDGYQKFPNFGIIKTPHYYHFIDYYQPLARIQAHATARGNEQKVDVAVKDVIKGSSGEMRMVDSSLDFLNAKLPQNTPLNQPEAMIGQEIMSDVGGSASDNTPMKLMTKSKSRGRPSGNAPKASGGTSATRGRKRGGLDLTDYLV
jgi:hypothetical protein